LNTEYTNKRAGLTGSQFFQRFYEILGIRGSKCQAFAGDGMREREGMSVQGGTEDAICFGSAVQGITQQGISQRIGVDPDLVCPAGPGDRFKQTISCKPLQDVEMCLGRFPVAVVDHGAMFVTYIDAQWMAGGVFVPGGCADEDGMVDLLGLVPLELYIQDPMCFCRPGEDQYTAGNFIQPMDDPHFPELLFQLFDQVGGILFPTIRQDGNSSWFVDNED
jgi:hypothetical protein